MIRLTEKDAEKYLSFGLMSQPFLEDKFIESQLIIEIEKRKEQGLSASKLESLYFWINKNVKFTKDEEFKSKHKFHRTAKEIWDSKIVTGCSDMALLFATFARQIGIPATILHTAEYNWLQAINEGQKLNYGVGHCFCECFYEGKWKLVDPTARKIEEEYNLDCIELSYSLGGDNKFVPFFRCVDANKLQNVREYNKFMVSMCKRDNNEEIKPD